MHFAPVFEDTKNLLKGSFLVSEREVVKKQTRQATIELIFTIGDLIGQSAFKTYINTFVSCFLPCDGQNIGIPVKPCNPCTWF